MKRFVHRFWSELVILAIGVIGMYMLWAWCNLWCSVAIAEENQVTYRVCITTGTLNIRSKPGMGAEIMGSLYPGDTVKVDDFNNGWSHVIVAIEAGEGWVKSEYLTTGNTATGQYTNTSGGRVRIRDSAGGEFVGWLKAGKSVTVTSWAVDTQGNQWAFIGNGYVSAACITKVEEGL